MAKNYYLILGVSSDASREDLKAAFRRRALELHPDRSGLESGPFQELQEAYSVLMDPDRRRRYDQQHPRSTAVPRRFGVTPESLVSERPPVEPFCPLKTARNVRDFSVAKSFESFRPSFDALFDRFWSNFENLTRPKAERLESLTIEVVLSPEEAAWGGQVQIGIPSQAPCEACDGHGAMGPYECWQCQGHGIRITTYPLTVEYPAGLRDGHAVSLPLSQFGIQNFYLNVLFRVS